MIRKSIIEILVGFFMLAGFLALIFLVFKVSGLTDIGHTHYYKVYADFDNTGSLKPHAPVTIGGVKVGEVGSISLDNQTFRARVSLLINDQYNQIPSDSSASIFTQGILGSNYISLTPGFANDWLKSGSEIENTRSAIILENLIGQFMLSLTNKSEKASTSENTPTVQSSTPPSAPSSSPLAPSSSTGQPSISSSSIPMGASQQSAIPMASNGSSQQE